MDKIATKLPSSLSWRVAAPLVALYLLTVRLLRYRHRDNTARKYAFNTRESYASMTTQQAWEIQRVVFNIEFPFTALKAIQFALFRTYGIPSISKLLVSTKQLSSSAFSPKRYADTEVLIQEFVLNPPEDPRTIEAIARINFIHSRYQQRGLISNDDMLYTLSVFPLEPARWIARHEWRALTDLELCALGTFWKAQGDAMAIDMSALFAHAAHPDDIATDDKGAQRFRDGLAWLRAVDAWSTAYERRAMLPHADNHTTARETVTLLLYDAPRALHPAGAKVVTTLMDERLRLAMLFPAPPRALYALTTALLTVRKLLIRHVFLPRPWALEVRALSWQRDANGRLHTNTYQAEPWYVAQSFYGRWIDPWAWVKRAVGNPTPGEGWMSEGYLIPEVGPRGVSGKGVEEQRGGEERLRRMGRGGCPFA